ncbi:MAG: MBL fold metallo-hydrolase [Anaerolineae bacterium]|jgi:glyoxylase-like metal-dependent hydrolase (beta-lactamase superfamily II)
MQVEQVSDTIHKFTFALSDQPDALAVNTAACVGPDGILLVDAGWAPTAERLNEKVRALNDGHVKLIIVTHPHRDHYGGCALFGQEATLIAHQNTTDELSGRYFALDPLPGQELPIITLEDELSLRFNEDIRIIPAPGHTHSDVVVYFVDSGVVCLGDLLFSDTFPGLDPARDGDVERYIESIGKLIARFPADVKLIAGHGRDYTLDELRVHYRMTVDTTDLIRQGLADGKTAQDMIEEELLKDWAEWSNLITAENWVTVVCDSLSGQMRQPIAEPLTYTILEKGIAAALEQYQKLKTDQPDAYDFGENQLNMLGYHLLWRGLHEAAISVFELNIQVYPESANPYDSLGEAYATVGNKGLAIENYEKALELDSSLPSAIDALETLRSGEES